MKKKIALLCSLVFSLYTFPVSALDTSTENISLSEFPQAITQQMIDQNGLVKRLSRFDNELNAIGYENADGTETVFIFGEDVKYIDDNGNVRDKDVSIVETSAFKKLSGYEYETKSNDVKVSFAKEMSSSRGLKLEYGNRTVTLAPITGNKNSASLTASDSKKITYQNAIDQNTHIRFETTFSGIKEDIILDKYTGKNEFSFVLNTGGLIPKAENGGVTLSSKDEVVMEIPPAYVIDSNGNSTINNDIELTLINGSLYTLTVVVDNAFLTSQDTVYPVYIDPSITVTNTYIEDATAYQANPGQNYGSALANSAGMQSSGMTFFFTKFSISPLVNAGITYDEVLGAYYSCRSVYPTPTVATLNCYQVTGNWSESTLTYNTMPSWNYEKLTSMNIYEEPVSGSQDYGDWYDFYITSAVMSWLQGVPNYGLAFLERTGTMYRELYSNESPSNPPYVSVCYQSQSDPVQTPGIAESTPYFIKNKKTGQYLTHGLSINSSATVAGVDTSAFTGNLNQFWLFTHKGNGEYVIYPGTNSNMRLVTIGTFDTLPLNLNVADDTSPYHRWKIRRNYNGTFSFFTMSVSSGIKTFASDTTNSQPTLCDYSADYNLKDEWTLEQVFIGTTNIYSFTHHNDYNITTYQTGDLIADNINENYTATNNINAHALAASNSLTTSSAWLFMGHGLDDGMALYFNTYDSSTQTWSETYLIGATIETTDESLYGIGNLSNNACNKLQIAVLAACFSGNTYSTEANLTGMTYLKGAGVTIGFVGELEDSFIKEWLEYFFDNLLTGATVYNAMQAADSYVAYGNTNSDLGNTNQSYVIGDTSKVIFRY